MKHLAQIHAEFVKYAADHLGWWEAMSNAEQKDYISRHPKTRMRLTPEKHVDPSRTMPKDTKTRGTPEEVDLKKQIAHKVLRQLRRHPGDAHVDSRLDPEGNLQYDVKPGHQGLNPGHLIYKKDDKVYEALPRVRGDEKDPEIKPDEAASIIRHHMGHEDMDHMKKKKGPKPESDASLAKRGIIGNTAVAYRHVQQAFPNAGKLDEGGTIAGLYFFTHEVDEDAPDYVGGLDGEYTVYAVDPEEGKAYNVGFSGDIDVPDPADEFRALDGFNVLKHQLVSEDYPDGFAERNLQPHKAKSDYGFMVAPKNTRRPLETEELSPRVNVPEKYPGEHGPGNLTYGD